MIRWLSNSKLQVDLALYHWDQYRQIIEILGRESWLASSIKGMQEKALSLSDIMVLQEMIIYVKIIHQQIYPTTLPFYIFIGYLQANCWIYYDRSNILFSNLQSMISSISLLNPVKPISMYFQRICFFCKCLLVLRVYPIFEDHCILFSFLRCLLWNY